MKPIDHLTESEAIEILKFVFPNEEGIIFDFLSFEIKKGKASRVNLINSNTGINFHIDKDEFTLKFSHMKVVLWLYQNGYDISHLLEANTHLTDTEYAFQHFSTEIFLISNGIDKNGNKIHSLSSVIKRCKELLKEYDLEYSE